MVKMKYTFIVSLFLFSGAFSETILIPGDYNSIQLAIDAASNGDSLIVSPGTYSENIDFLGKQILVSSEYYINADSSLIALTVIDAGSNASAATFKNNESASSILQGFTLQNGVGNSEDPDDNGSFFTYGGGIYFENSSPTVKDCIIQNNTADQGGGGGLFCYNASPVFFRCLITGNATDDVGGGLYAREGSEPKFYNCVFQENTAEFGGGCYLRNESSPEMEDVVFINNIANNSGGGISLKDNADLLGTNIEVVGNEADGLGGGLYINNADPSFSFLLIADNISSSGGGGYIRNNSSVDFTNTTISNNSAGLYGEGLYIRDETDLSFQNSIIWGNGSSQIYFRSNGEEVEVTINYSLVQDLQDGIIQNDNGLLIWGNGNFDEEPYFCNAPSGDYYIRENSPCLYGGEEGALVGCFAPGCGPINAGPVWYIDASGNDENDGSLTAPFSTIQRAIAISVDGDTIRLNEGVYTEEIDFQYKNLVLESMAYFSDDMQLVQETSFGSSLVGGSCFVLDGPSNNNAEIRGLSFKGGSEPNGGGLVVSNCSPKFENLIIEDNNAEIGGGLYLSDSDAEFNNVVVRNNGANLGGGIYVSGGSPVFTNLLLSENVAYWGGGIYTQNSNLNVIYSIITKNESFIEGGALYQNGGISNVSWTSFEDNNGYDYGGAIVVNQATSRLDQITFAGNSAGVGSAISMNSSDVVISNSILWSNSESLFYSPGESGVTSLEISFSNIQEGIDVLSEMSSVILTDGGSNYNVDPIFCDIDVSQYNLQESSSCLTMSDSGGVIGSHLLGCDQVLSTLKEAVPVKFSLMQNYPNPFNPSTNIKIEILNREFYDLSIYNLSGQLIIKLFSEIKESGFYTVNWNSLNKNGFKVPSGVYVYVLKNSKYRQTKKMILMK